MSGRRSRQGGAIGLIVILIALVIVGFLYKDALKSYLMSSTPPPVTTKAGTPGERARAAGAIGAEAFDTSSAPVAPQGAIDRARGIEDTVKQQAEQRAKQSESTRY